MVMVDGKRVAYWLDELEPDPHRKGCYRVCLVIENEPGYRRMGDESRDQSPWYWDRATCDEQNRRLGHSPVEAFEIVASSMFSEKHTL